MKRFSFWQISCYDTYRNFKPRCQIVSLPLRKNFGKCILFLKENSFNDVFRDSPYCILFSSFCNYFSSCNEKESRLLKRKDQWSVTS